MAVQSGWLDGGGGQVGRIGGGKAEFRCSEGKAPSGGVRSGVMQI